jgi:hypothetical protein
MKKFLIGKTAILTAILVLACAVQCAAQGQEKGYWRAASNTAASITGDIAFSDLKVSIDFKSFPLAPVRSLQPPEVASVFDADATTANPGKLYRLNIAALTRFLRHNTLCGSEDTQWMATYLTGKTLQVAFFSGDEPPVFTMDAMTNSSRLCGTFSYVR